MRLFKKISLLIVVLLTTIILFGCSSSTATDAVDEYLKKIQTGEIEVQKLIKGTEIDYDDLTEETKTKLLESIEKITYKINNEEYYGDTAVVNLKVNSIDFEDALEHISQEFFKYIFDQAFLGVEMTSEERSLYLQEVFEKYLDNASYVERTGDISLHKVENNWVVKEDYELMNLLTGLDRSKSNYDFEDNEYTKDDNEFLINKMELGVPLTIKTEKGDYRITLKDARIEEQTNVFLEEVKKLACLDYVYENINYEGEEALHIYEDNFQILDSEGNVLNPYPLYNKEKMSAKIDAGESCEATATYIIESESNNLNVIYKDPSHNVAIIVVPVE